MEPISAAILAGGQSRRMGRDKALVRIGNRTLLEIVARRVQAVAAELFVVATNGSRYAELGFRVVPDVFMDTGSLGGIYSALNAASFEHCLVVGCDMPFLTGGLLTFMVSQPREYDALVPVLGGDRSDQGYGATYETLHAIYARSALPAIERRLAAGKFKIADLLGDIRVRELDEAIIRRYDPELRSFFNANTPDDIALVERSILSDQSC